MDTQRHKVLKVLAPAKVNLYLHVTGRLENGYHTLDSLVSFADIGDELIAEPSNSFSFEIKGPFAQGFSAREMSADPDSENLVVKAIWALARMLEREPQMRLTLVKKLPLASGIGGGSSDAAAAIWSLCEWWGVPPGAPQLPAVLAALGADVPVCFSCRPRRMQGAGEILSLPPYTEDIPVVLVNPGKRCSTAEVFARFDKDYLHPLAVPNSFSDLDDFIAFLAHQENSLTHPALEVVPEIAFVMKALEGQKGCRIARMSGSGATCFALFASEEEAQEGAESILAKHPEWWVRAGTLNRPERY